MACNGLLGIPLELKMRILALLPPAMILTCRQVSKHFFSLTKEPHLWASIAFPAGYPKPIVFSDGTSSLELEQASAQMHNITSFSSPDSSMPPFYFPNRPTTITGNFKDVIDIRLLRGGQLLATLYRTHLCIWKVPMAPIQARLLATTSNFQEPYIEVSVIEEKSSVQLYIITQNFVMVYRLSLSVEPIGLMTLIPTAIIELTHKVPAYQNQRFINNRYFVYLRDGFVKQGEQYAMCIVDCMNLQVRLVHLTGIEKIKTRVWGVSVIGIVARCLVVQLRTERTYLCLYPLPEPDLEVISQPDGVVSLAPSGRVVIQHSREQHIHWVRTFGDRFVGVLVTEAGKLMPSSPGAFK
ncbi:hypothetical protein DL96DRAFT_624766 [Flagelloscypha sp. PMI_526]|nr:hypothetical protein DL96DRAFT_624766 [Flagelloscypha sp. PMI_526]